MKIGIDEIMSFGPCEEYTKERITETWKRNKIRKYITLDQALNLDIPAEDVLWLVLRPEFIQEKELHLHGCHFAEQALESERKAGREPHPDSWNAIKIKRKWLKGKATDGEHAAAGAAAAGAAWAAAARAAATAEAGAWAAAARAAATGAAASRAAWEAAAATGAAREKQLKYLKKYYNMGEI